MSNNKKQPEYHLSDCFFICVSVCARGCFRKVGRECCCGPRRSSQDTLSRSDDRLSVPHRRGRAPSCRPPACSARMLPPVGRTFVADAPHTLVAIAPRYPVRTSDQHRFRYGPKHNPRSVFRLLHHTLRELHPTTRKHSL